MDFLSDARFDEKRFRCLTVVDNFSFERLVIVVRQSLRSEDAATTLERLGRSTVRHVACRPKGPAFVSVVPDKWAYEHGVTIDV